MTKHLHHLSWKHLIVALFFLQCNIKASEKTTTNSRPNIIFIMADDLGYADLGCYGQKRIATPHIDRLASEGVRFTQVYAGSTVCAPSRSVLMTGQHLGHTTVRGNSSALLQSASNPQGRVPLADSDSTVAEVLKGAGYVTGITGKWGLGEPGTEGIPNKQGFDEWFGYLNQKKAHSYYPEYLWKNEKKIVLDGNANSGRQVYSHDLMTDFALDFIERHQDTSFFLYIPYTIPHDRYEVPELGQYSDSTWSEQEKAFAAMVSRMDYDIGRIVQTLKGASIDENTIIFFCSDNGAAQRWEGVFDSSGELKGRKRDLYEGGIRTPMVVRYPGKIRPGVNTEAVWYFADVLPTLAAIAGVSALKEIDGVNIWPCIIEDRPLPDDRFLYWEFYEKRFGQAVRWQNWKAVKNDVGSPWELYDISSDISEKKNLSDERKDVVEKIEAWIEQNRTESPHWASEM
jgi:arylsulfatase A-like enzyme